MNQGNIGHHETYELHELMTFKNVCATKAAAMAGMVTDPELKAILQQDVQTTKGHLKDLQNILQSSLKYQ